MINDYIVNDKVARGRIALDVKRRKLTRIDIENLCNNQQIKTAFLNSAYNDKHNKSEWSKEYLEILSRVAVAESFNLDYLLYLEEVAEYVSRATHKKTGYVSRATYEKVIIAGIIITLMIIVGVIVY